MAWDRADPHNGGVMEGHAGQNPPGPRSAPDLVDPLTGKAYEFLTNEPDLPPGVLVELYRRRWDIEKVFDVLKTSWAKPRRGARVWNPGRRRRNF
jgi:hypothetical protein